MDSVGIRELRQRASELIRRVETGETIEVTDRGLPVAVLAPIAHRSPLERMRAAGDIVAPSESLAGLPDPLALTGMPPSEVIAQMRAEER